MAQHSDGPGTAPTPGGGSGAAGGTNDVELTFADVEKIGQDTSALSAEAQAAKASLGDARGDSGSFGSYGPARAVYAHHQAVVNVFEDTLAAITTDLDDFGNAIVQAVHAYEQTDDNASASLASVAAKLDPNGLRDRNEESRNQQGNKLDDVTTDDLKDFEGEHPDLDGDVAEDVRHFINGGNSGDSGAGGAFSDGDGR
jgi:hypothetical protein